MKRLVCCLLIGILLLSSLSVCAMSTVDFDNGMAKGISYFNRGMYYEAKDEFQWFCDYNWGALNPGQQQYALDYLDGTKAKIHQLENKITVNYFYFNLLGKTRTQIESIFGPQIDSMWYGGPLYYFKNSGGERAFGFDQYKYASNGEIYAPPNSKCTTIVLSAGDIFKTSNWHYNNLGRIIEVLDEYHGKIYSEINMLYYYEFKHNNCTLIFDLPEYNAPISADTAVWLYKK